MHAINVDIMQGLHNMTFDDYLSSFSLKGYPFSVYTAEGEAAFLDKTYVAPSAHSTLVQTIRNTSAIVVGERGTGKTALSLNLQEKIKNSSSLIVSIDEFSDLEAGYSAPTFYSFLLKRMVERFFDQFSNSPLVLWRLSKDDRKDLSLFLSEFVGASTRRQLSEKISKIQNGLIKRSSIYLYNSIRGIFNYGLGAITKVASDALTSHFSALPPVTQSDIDYFRQISVEVDDEFSNNGRDYRYLERFCSLVRKLKIDSIIVFIDKADEDPRLENDSEMISAFLRPALSDNKILTSGFFNIVFFVWSTPFNNIKGNVRTQKISLESLDWTIDSLNAVLVSRVNAFMEKGKEISNASELFSDNSSKEQDEIYAMANGNPRDLWHLIDKCFKIQFSLDFNKKIENTTISEAINNYVSGFNYYEYYPRRAKARADTMDIYSYIAHLKKLNTIEFTKNQFKTQAGTGGSTTNYIISMENMGLIKKTPNKGQNGAVIYTVKDPKVRYAIQYGIEITKP